MILFTNSWDNEKIDFIIYRKGQRKHFSFTLQQRQIPAIRVVYPEFEPEATDYEILGGMVLFKRVEHLIRKLMQVL